MCLFTIKTEAVNLEVFNEDEYRTFMYDKDSGYLDKELFVVDFYMMDLSPYWKETMQQQLGYNNNIKSQIHFIKYKVLSKFTSPTGYYEYEFECYNKDNALIYKSQFSHKVTNALAYDMLMSPHTWPKP
jgi:hypothetical protein